MHSHACMHVAINLMHYHEVADFTLLALRVVTLGNLIYMAYNIMCHLIYVPYIAVRVNCCVGWQVYGMPEFKAMHAMKESKVCEWLCHGVPYVHADS